MYNLLTLFKNLKFRNKLFISYLVVCIIPIMVLGFYSYSQANDFLREQAKQGLSESVRQISGNISFRCRQYQDIINSVTYNFRFQQIFNENYEDFPSLYRDYVDPFFNNILNFNKDILQISVFTDNPEISRGDYILPIKTAEDQPWFFSGAYMKGTQWYMKNGKLLCTQMFSGSYLKKGIKPAMFFMSIDTGSLFEGIDNVKSPVYGITVVDSQGMTILSRMRGIKAIPGIKEMRTAGENGVTLGMNGENYIVIKSVISEPGWEIYYYTPVNAISIDAKRIVGATVAITAICIITLFFIILVFSNTFVKRINNLNQKMQIVEKGNLDIEVSSCSRDEIGELTNRFGKMLNNLNSLIKEVYQSKLTQKEAELRALQSQINPHFLYNTLSIINWKAIQANELEISEITNTVSRFYRTVLNKGRNTISVRDEVENAKSYIYIQMIMHNNKFDFISDIDDKMYDYEMINLILQPILENAIEHGVDKIRKGTGKGVISLKGWIHEEKMLFSVKDNGPGMDVNLKKEILMQSSKGYGLKNVNERIRIYFGMQYGLSIESTPGVGTDVTVTIPLQKQNNINN